MRNRTIARELALQALYQLDLRCDYMTGDIEAFCKENTDKPDIYQFAMSLIQGCRSHIEEIDEKISRVAEHWDMHRMAIIDKNILRLGVYELHYRLDIPPKVSINEAIDLAKKFSTKNSGTFVNGILDKIYTQFENGKSQETPVAVVPPDIAEIDYGNADLHVHTNLSDGTMSPEEVVDEAIRLGVTTISITDHDTVDGVVAATRYGQNKNIHVIAGIELSAYLAPSEIHILGYFIDVNNASLQRILKQANEDRRKRIHAMVDKLSRLGVFIDPEDVFTLAGRAAPGRMHIAETIWKRGYCKTMAEVFARYIGDSGPAYVPKETLNPQQAVELIRDAGGAAVMAHPGLTQRDQVIENLVKYGLKGIEVYYPSHTPQDVRKYLTIAKKHNLIATGGSDFHGERKAETPIALVTIPGSLVSELKKSILHEEKVIRGAVCK